MPEVLRRRWLVGLARGGQEEVDKKVDCRVGQEVDCRV